MNSLDNVFTGSLVSIVRNDEGLYEGNLRHYFRAIVHATNVNHPYHHFGHMGYVVWRCYQALKYYALFPDKTISQVEARVLLVSAMFHDFGHSGGVGMDSFNIERAISGLRKCILTSDTHLLPDFEYHIRMTEHPAESLKGESGILTVDILRDADLTSGLQSAWIQNVIFGLAAEKGLTPVEALRLQIPFYEDLKFRTSWAREIFSPSVIEAKRDEILGLLEILLV